MESMNLSDNWFDFLFYFCILNGSLAFLEIKFFAKFTGTTLKGPHYMIYIAMMYAVFAAEIQMEAPFPVSTCFEIMALFGFACFLLRCPPMISAVTTILTITTMQVVNGIFQSIINIFCTFALPHLKFITAFLILNSLLTILAAGLSYRYIIKAFSAKEVIINRYVLLLLLPILFVLLVVQQVFIAYGNTVVLNSEGVKVFPKVDDWQMLIIQIAAYFCLMAVLFAYRKLSEGFQLQMQQALLEQQLEAQKNYIQEVQARYEQTRAFRHDVKSHWTVLLELLKREENQKALEYLNKLQLATDTLSFACQTGNIIIDMLLSNKLGIALQIGIQVDCSVKIPPNCGIDEMDLCIVLSNSVDNAIKACDTICGRKKWIQLSAVQKGSFFMIEIKNNYDQSNPFHKGSGLGLLNIRAVAEKYNGTMSIDQNGEFFKLNVLFVIPQHPVDI